MVNIKDIKHGWLTFLIENKSFRVSYLTDIKQELFKFMDLTHAEDSVKRVLLDGEGKDLYLTAWLDWRENIVIVWETDKDDVSDERNIFILNFDEFKQELLSIFKENEELYNEQFLMLE